MNRTTTSSTRPGFFSRFSKASFAASAVMLAIFGCAVGDDELELEAPDDVDSESEQSAVDANGTGLRVSLYPTMTFTGTPVTRTDATVDFDWGGGSPATGIPVNGFSARWTGDIVPRYTETYTFITTSDDGVRLWVDGQKIIDNYTDHAPTENRGTITLTAGRRYTIRLDYYENTGGAVMKLAWQSARQARQIVPRSQLFPVSQPSGEATPCWPYDRPSIAALRGSSKKVFAHYFSPYPLSLDNQPPATDYYARHYLNPDGEGGKFFASGGLLTERPTPQTPRPAGTDYVELNSQTEIRRAAAIGMDGFIYDLLSTSGAHWTRLLAMLRAIPKTDAGFKVLLTFDMNTSSFGSGTTGRDEDVRAAIVNVVRQVGNDPSLQRLPDGRLVLSAYASQKRSPAFWKTTLDQLASLGYRVAFMPMSNAQWEPETRALLQQVPVYATTVWGGRTVNGATAQKNNIAKAHDMGVLWMAPVAPQDSRPKNLNYVESSNSGAFRALWDAAITGGADWVQMITWNDYSEDSEIEPSSKTNTAFYDLTGFYTTWFKTGTMPTIRRDALYYFHRANSVDPAVARPTRGQPYNAVNGPAGENMIEVVGLLTAPGTLQIVAGGRTQSKDVGAGVQSFRVPLVNGKPSFRLVRNGAVVTEFASATTINNTIAFVDPLYHAGASLTCPLQP